MRGDLIAINVVHGYRWYLMSNGFEYELERFKPFFDELLL